ncbi:hypothetical protein C1H46_038312 [Malus baccata]|uniref:Uncharacterized protein n=1 Tax=Malus baccata TaxID=106549 RepID=A0A540KPJ0_MALBA|nr:hypothetical protein C1H46_038312 [Malus baccata]
MTEGAFVSGVSIHPCLHGSSQWCKVNNIFIWLWSGDVRAYGSNDIFVWLCSGDVGAYGSIDIYIGFGRAFGRCVWTGDIRLALVGCLVGAYGRKIFILASAGCL